MRLHVKSFCSIDDVKERPTGKAAAAAAAAGTQPHRRLTKHSSSRKYGPPGSACVAVGAAQLGAACRQVSLLTR